MFYDDYNDENYEEELIDPIQLKKQYLIEHGVSPDRIRPDGTYVMTKDEFVTQALKDLRKKKDLEFKEKTNKERETKELINNARKKEEEYTDYMTKMFMKRRKRRRK